MGERLTAIVEFLEKEDADQKARRKVHNDVINQRKRELRLAERANAGS
jgi:acyl dehydratase